MKFFGPSSEKCRKIDRKIQALDISEIFSIKEKNLEKDLANFLVGPKNYILQRFNFQEIVVFVLERNGI